MTYRSTRRRQKKSPHASIITLAVAVCALMMVVAQQYIEMALYYAVAAAVVGATALAFAVAYKAHSDSKARAGLRILEFDEIDAMTGTEFERYVGAMLEARGFQSVHYTARSNDDGIDILARHKGKKYAVQTKRYSDKARKNDIQPVHSAYKTKRYKCDKAMVVTNCYFTKHARDYAEMTGVMLVDRDELAKWRVDVK